MLLFAPFIALVFRLLGPSLLAVLASLNGSMRAAVASGLLCGVGVYSGYSIVPLVPGASLSDIPTRSPHGPYLAELVGTVLTHGAGVFASAARFSPAEVSYSGLAAAYPLLLLVLVGFALRRGSDARGERERSLSRAITEGLGLSALGLLGALWVTRYEFELPLPRLPGSHVDRVRELLDG